MHFDPSLVLADAAPRVPYQNNAATASFEKPLLKGLHFGQRKLMLSEVEFCVEVARQMEARYKAAAGAKKALIVYAGAACGLHLPFLFSMFPAFDFVLIDPAPFCAQVKEIAARDESCVLELIEDICTPELCLRLRRSYCETHDIYLVSDIRSGQPTGMSLNQEHTDMIQQDNNTQREWCFSLEVQAAMLKFHPPYPAVKDAGAAHFSAMDTTAEEYVYLDGTALLGVWAPKSSSEVRLVVVGPFTRGYAAPTRRYYCTAHEERCYAYNISGRYEKDCAAERLILQSYLDAFPGTYESVEHLSRLLSERLEYPLFVPLEPGFTEQHARWVSLLYSSGRPAALRFFDTLKDHMSVEQVAALVTTYKDEAEMPQGVKVGEVELTPPLWAALADADFSVVYGFPFFRWGWRQRPSRRTGAPSGGGQAKQHAHHKGPTGNKRARETR